MCIYSSNKKEKCNFYKKKCFQNQILPLDRNNLCIFHSHDKTWKEVLNFKTYLEELITFYENFEKPLIDLRGIVFTEVINKILSGRTFNLNLCFENAIFLQKVVLKKVKFNNGANFANTKFTFGLSIYDAYAKRLDFESAICHGGFLLEDLEVLSFFLLNKVTIYGALEIKNSTLRAYSSFEYIRVNVDSKEIRFASFKDVFFGGATSFDFSEFNNLVQFESITIEDTLSFKQTKFKCASTQPIFASVGFVDIKIKEKGRLSFLGNVENKIFSQCSDVRFNNCNLEGILSFEHCDFSKLDNQSKTKFINDSKTSNSKIKIGKGCIKYNFQTPLITIDVQYDNQVLVSELCNTFRACLKIKLFFQSKR